jgi:hypothetical protein
MVERSSNRRTLSSEYCEVDDPIIALVLPETLAPARVLAQHSLSSIRSLSAPTNQERLGETFLGVWELEQSTWWPAHYSIRMLQPYHSRPPMYLARRGKRLNSMQRGVQAKQKKQLPLWRIQSLACYISGFIRHIIRLIVLFSFATVIVA